MIKRLAQALFVLLAVTQLLWAAPVVFNDANLAQAVRTQWETATGDTLSDPPEDSELADSRFTELVVRNASISDLTGLAACTALTKLDLAWNAITDVTPIGSLTDLTYLELGFGDLLNEQSGGPQPGANQITDISPLASLTNLEYLNIAGNDNLADISAVASMDSLITLWLGFNSISDFSPLQDVADTLTFFVSIMAGLADEDLAYVAAMTNLDAFGFYGESAITDLSPLAGLNPSMFICGYMNIADISAIANYTNLTSIMLDSLGITDLDAFSNLINLRQVNAAKCAISDISGLEGLTNIESMSLENNQIIDIAALATLSSLREISLDDNLITDIQALVDNPSLGGNGRVRIRRNLLSQDAACVQLPALRAKFDNPGNVESDAVCGNAYTLIVQHTGTGNTYPEEGAHQYAEGSAVYINAKPEPGAGYAFDHWEGDVPPGQDPSSMSLQLVMDADKTITAVFSTAVDYTLDLIKTGPGANNGRTEPEPGVSSYKANQSAYLSYRSDDKAMAFFAGWSGDASGYHTQNLLMDQNKTVTATFLTSGYTLRVNTSGQGGIDSFPTNEDVRLAAGAAFSLLANGWTGARFDHWEGDLPDGAAATDNPLPITMDQDRNLTAVFVTGGRQLTIATGGTGTGTTQPSPGVHNYFDGEFAYINATPSGSSAFIRWDGDIGAANANSPNLQLLMDQDRSVTAIFGPAAWTLTVQKTGNGDTNPSPGVYGFGNNVQTGVNANLISGGDAFDRWLGDIPSGVPSTDNFINLTMDRNRTVTAQFLPGDYTLTMAKAGSGCGNPYPAPGSYAYLAGRNAYINANVCEGSYFAGWSGDVSGFDRYLNFPMDGNMSVTANYATDGYTLTTAVSGQGFINQNIGANGYVAGAVVTVASNGAPQGWRFSEWTGDLPEGADPTAVSLQIPMDRDRAITAVFVEEAPATLTIIIEGSGETSPAGAAAPGLSYSYGLGQQAYLEAMRGMSGWAFSHWSGDIGGNTATSNRIILSMNQNRTVTANYVSADYNLTIAYTGNGSTWPEPGIYGYLSGAEAEFGANLIAGGDAFDQWTGDFPAGRNPQETHHRIIMDQDRSLTAAFVPGDFSLTINDIAGGGVAWLDPQPGTYSYITGRTARAEIRLNDGAFWGGWTGGVSSLDYLLRFPISADVTVTPNVAASGYFLTTASSDAALGSATPSGTLAFASGVLVPITATPTANAYFVNWTGDLSSGADPNTDTINILMDQNRSVTANFAEFDYYLYLQTQGEGVTNPTVGIHWYNDGDQPTITASPAYGYFFHAWSGLNEGEGDPANPEITITIHEDRIVTAIFMPSTVSVPDVTGLPQEQAEDELTAAGFLVGDVNQEHSSSILEGNIISQNPPAGVSVTFGATITLVVSLGPSQEMLPHSSDQNADYQINLTELLRVIQFFNSGGYYCVTPPATSEDGYLPGTGGGQTCAPHSSDYNPQNWQISLTELLRLIQFFNTGGYYVCPDMGTEDGYCPGQAPE